MSATQNAFGANSSSEPVVATHHSRALKSDIAPGRRNGGPVATSALTVACAHSSRSHGCTMAAGGA